MLCFVMVTTLSVLIVTHLKKSYKALAEQAILLEGLIQSLFWGQ